MSKVKIRHRDSGNEFHAVLICTLGRPFGMRVSDGAILASEVPSPDAIEASALSGIAYGWRSFGRPQVDVEVTHLSGICDPENVEGFAVASMCALASSIKKDEQIAEFVPDEWEVLLMER